MQAVIARRDAFGEAQLAHRISEYLPEQGQLFVGNSLVVRLIDALSQLPAGYPVYSNRGASGIDGLLSTAAGVQRGKRQTDAGDCGRSLRTLRSQRAGVIASGFRAAGINCGEQQRRANFLAAANAAKRARAFLSDAANVHFEHAAAMFELKYHRPQNWQELETAFADAWRTPTTTVIEMVVNDTDGAQTLQQLLAQVSHL
ncbi:2-succinyl-5-enolpyruvyl-6-hydroxy-3-cyclohexene-1-carboxylate synthase [Escherichia coli]|uniref:2-succinyl-5-enolpyruvyl-6-hydroxy-3-cyclohexene-1-carboxylate synthase n=1 Tax=Escherichia coli TaxID=562 RepID=A0A2X1LCE2_ECOLX|nr:2-succinyl-5-enolpyruvyl-6-hydroxy-3-cyclohexene-1-carboxylate synthase [Escherichia coli]